MAMRMLSNAKSAVLRVPRCLFSPGTGIGELHRGRRSLLGIGGTGMNREDIEKMAERYQAKADAQLLEGKM